MKSIKLFANIISILLVAFQFTFTSCSKENDICNVSVISKEGGVAVSTENEVAPGSNVILTATPNEGYEFLNWTIKGEIVSADNPYTVNITKNSRFEANFIKISNVVENPESEDGHYYVDLGLSVKWATCNIGANEPQEYGDYFSWGETEPKLIYTSATYAYRSSPLTSSLSEEEDAAHIVWGGSWRMPTVDEFDELRDARNCAWVWSSQNGVKGYKVISLKESTKGRYIFLPAAGYYNNQNLCYDGSDGLYWSASFAKKSWAFGLNFGKSYKDGDYYNCFFGSSIRPVHP